MEDSQISNILIITPTYPPTRCGVADYSKHVANLLSEPSNDVKVISGDQGIISGERRGGGLEELLDTFDSRKIASFSNITRGTKNFDPDIVLFQYNPFSFGKYGVNFGLPIIFRRIRALAPHSLLVVMAHEVDQFPPKGFRKSVGNLLRQLQLRAIASYADSMCFSTEFWSRKYSTICGGRVRHLPIASNIEPDPARIKHREELSENGVNGVNVIVFGRLNQLLCARLQAFFRLCDGRGLRASLSYIGGEGQKLRGVVEQKFVRMAQPLPEKEVSSVLLEGDLFLTGFPEGITTRRGSVMAALAHGLAIVGTKGPMTDTELKIADGRAFLLAESDDENTYLEYACLLANDTFKRRQLGDAARDLYVRSYSWSRLKARLKTTLDSETKHNIARSSD